MWLCCVCVCVANVYPPPSSCVELLLAAGAAVDAVAAGGQTPLFLACETGRLDCARVLLGGGADRSLTTAVRWNVRRWRKKIIPSWTPSSFLSLTLLVASRSPSH